MKISVLTPSFNSVKFIDRAVKSVLRQDYYDWEHIIVDGGSTDGTVDAIKSYKHLYWISEADNGQSSAMNKAFRIAKGDIIIYLNADDELAPGVLMKINDVFSCNTNVEMVVGNLWIDKNGEISEVRPSIKLGEILEFKSYHFPYNPVCYPYKRSLQVKIGDFPEDNHYTMDYWFLLRAYLFANIIRIDVNCGTYYITGENKSSNNERGILQLKKVRKDFVIRYFYRKEVLIYLFLTSFTKIRLSLSQKVKYVLKRCCTVSSIA
jgi:glycosyltransferase involved in cell wall biosynthesis